VPFHLIAAVPGDTLDAPDASAIQSAIGDDRLSVARVAPSERDDASAPERQARAASAGLDAGTADYAIVLRPGDRLVPGAVGRLLRAAKRGGSAGAIGAWTACDPDGRAAGPEADPPRDADGRLRSRVDLDAFLGGYAPAGCAVLLDRRALGRRRFAAALGEVAELDLWLRVVEGGDRFAVAPSVVAARPPSYSGSLGRWATVAESAIAVLRRAFSRAATLGFESAGVDLTEARERESVLAVALRIATRSALADPDPRRAAATELLRPHADRDAITPELAAWAAVDALCRGEGFLPAVDGVSERLWSRAVRGWWSRCAGERWADKSLVDVGAGLLAERLVSRAEVARATMADQAGLWSPGERFCVAGAGPAAITMAAHAARAGCKAELLVDRALARVLRPDDVVDGSELSRGEVAVRPIDTQIGVDAPLVVVDEEDDDVLARFAARPNVARWSTARRWLEQRATTRLAAIWRQREAAAMV